MEDAEIIGLYWQRNEQAISETANKYGHYCHKISMDILDSPPDAEECVNDTWYRAWSSIPPERPRRLAAYLGAIVRRLSIDCYRRRFAGKRREGEFALSLEELTETCPGGAFHTVTADGNGEEEARLLGAVINAFLAGQSPQNRRMFVCRYYYFVAVADIATRMGVSESKVKTTLFRMRKALRKQLEREGIRV